MNTPIEVRGASPGDIDFLALCNAAMALETEHKHLNPPRLRAGIAAVFAQPARGFYLIAEREGRSVASLLITHEWSDWRNGDWWWIQSVYVLPEARRGGVFGALYAHVEARARALPDVVGLRLYVEKDNLRAQSTYRALGMDSGHYQLFERGFLEF